MAPDVAPAIEPVLDRPLAVDPAKIEAEFSRIWQETSDAGRDASSIRLRVLNFVGIGRGDDERDRFDAVMAGLPQSHPCRGVLAVVEDAREGIDATISAHCWRATGGSRHLCSEEVLLRAGPADEDALASAVLALLVPELPVTVWLLGAADPASHLLEETLEEADRAIIDSAGAPDPAVAWRALLQIEQTHDATVHDLAWRRTADWRAMIAQCFDSEDAGRQLRQLERISVSCGGDTMSGGGLLLAGWLISRLGLAVGAVHRSDGVLDATLRSSDGRTVALRLTATGGAAAALREVRIETAGAAFVVDLCDEEGRHLHVLQAWPDAPVEHTVQRDPQDDASLIAETLDEPARPALFVDAVRAALAVCGR